VSNSVNNSISYLFRGSFKSTDLWGWIVKLFHVPLQWFKRKWSDDFVKQYTKFIPHKLQRFVVINNALTILTWSSLCFSFIHVSNIGNNIHILFYFLRILMYVILKIIYYYYYFIIYNKIIIYINIIIIIIKINLYNN